jgi:hypothetical protein
LSSLTTVVLEADPAGVLPGVPALAGVGQILGPEGRNLLIGRPANLRRWFATHLGMAPGKPKPGKRPPTDLRPVATAIAYLPAGTAFEQRLLFERLMGRYVPVSARRDLKPPAFLHLDPEERFPRVTLRRAGDDLSGLFGPFRDRRAAEQARTALHKLIPLRPCDYTFEPDPALALGLGCLYAQVRTCAAPCLVRTSEADYRGLAGAAARVLGGQESAGDVAGWLPAWVAAGEGQRGLVIAKAGEEVRLFPVWEGSVLEERAVRSSAADVRRALEHLRWDPAHEPRDDWAWVTAWLYAPRRREGYLVLSQNEDADTLAGRVEGILESLGREPRGGRGGKKG